MRRLLLGGAALLLAWLVATLMRLAVEHHEHLGNSQLAADGRAMGWVPALLALAGVLFLWGALSHALQALLLRHRVAAKHHQPPRPQWRVRSRPRPRRTAGGSAPSREPHHWAWAALGLAPGTAWPEIRAHWRSQLRQWHPDAGGDLALWHRRQEAYRLLAAQLRR